MRLPLPKSRLVALCVLAAVLTTAVAVALANPGVLTNVASSVGDDEAGAAANAASPADAAPAADGADASHGDAAASADDHETGERDDHDEAEDE